MALLTVHFTRCIQDSHEFGSTHETIVSRVFFTIESEGTRTEGHADLKHAAGTDEFRHHVTAYYRACVLSTGILTLGPGARKVRVYGSVFKFPRQITFEADDRMTTRRAVT